MKIKIIRTILLALLLATFVIIFGFSNQDGEESTGISTKVSETIVNILHRNGSINENKIKAKEIELFVRKLAHFSIYLIVGLLLMGFTSTYNLDFSKKFVICIIIGIIYASTDEIHQLFIAGRSGQITDVFIDTFGVITGSLICNLIIQKCIKSRHQ